MTAQLALIEKHHIDVERELTLRQYIQSLNLSTEIVHLTSHEYENILKWIQVKYAFGQSFLEKNINDYHRIVKTFPKLEDWGNEGFPKRSQQYYLWILALSGRIQIGWHCLTKSLPPGILSQQQKLRIAQTIQELRYSSRYEAAIISGFTRIILVKQKELEQINSNDILEYCEQSADANKVARGFFFIGKKLLGFPEEWKTRRAKKKDRTVDLPSAMKNEYEHFQKNTENPTSRVSIQCFCDFLVRKYPEIEEYKDIEPDHLKAYALKLRRSQPPLADRTYNGYIGRIRQFLFFVSKTKKLSKNLTVYLGGIYLGRDRTKGQFSELIGDTSIILPIPVPQEERELLEQLIYLYSPSNKYEYLCISAVKLIYHTALRPREARALRLDCIRGTKEIPHIYVHRAKYYKERYIPMIAEVQALIDELQEYNRGAVPYYDDWDAETTKRLFALNGGLINTSTINSFFRKLLISGGLTDEDGNSKYSLYILRKIRITTWLEGGLTDIEVAELAGHGDLETIKFYLIGKENRLDNANKVYDTFYKDVIAEITATGTYKQHQKKQKHEEVEFIEKLKKELIQIENKGINRHAIDEVLKLYPEMVIPVPCGGCIAMIFFNEDENFECEKMKLPCLECPELKVTDNHIEKFDGFATRLYEAVVLNLKRNVTRLAERNLALIERLKKFYIVRFGLSLSEVEVRFSRLEPVHTRRGRKPKGV